MKKSKSEDETMDDSELIHTQDFDPEGEAATHEDYDVDFSGKLAPDYHLNFTGDSVSLRIGRNVVFSMPKTELKPEFQKYEYKTVVDMLQFFKKNGAAAWVTKYKNA